MLFQADHILDCRSCFQAPGSPAPAALDGLLLAGVPGRGSGERRAVGQCGPEAVFGEMAGFPISAHSMQTHRSSQYKLLPGIICCAPVQCKYLFVKAGVRISSYTDLKLVGGLREITGIVRAGSSQVLWQHFTKGHSWHGSCGVAFQTGQEVLVQPQCQLLKAHNLFCIAQILFKGSFIQHKGKSYPSCTAETPGLNLVTQCITG